MDDTKEAWRRSRSSCHHYVVYAFFQQEPPLEQQSLARRQYNERKRRAPEPIEGVDIYDDCQWGYEEIDAAIEQAHAIEQWDKEAAKNLLAQAQAAKKSLEGTTNLREPYDPMALYARELRFYKGSITDERLETMDYRRFLGYVREAELINEAEQREYYKGRQGQQSNPMEANAALNEFAVPQEYTGETVRLP